MHIQDARTGAKVHLRIVAGREALNRREPRTGLFQPLQKTADGRVTAGRPVLANQRVNDRPYAAITGSAYCGHCKIGLIRPLQDRLNQAGCRSAQLGHLGYD